MQQKVAPDRMTLLLLAVLPAISAGMQFASGVKQRA